MSHETKSLRRELIERINDRLDALESARTPTADAIEALVAGLRAENERLTALAKAQSFDNAGLQGANHGLQSSLNHLSAIVEQRTAEAIAAWLSHAIRASPAVTALAEAVRRGDWRPT